MICMAERLRQAVSLISKYLFTLISMSLAFQASAGDELDVTGVSLIRQEIANAKGNYSDLGPWTLEYKGNLPAGKSVSVIMVPIEAFVTAPQNDKRKFLVKISNPSALKTSLGNLVPIGVQVTPVAVDPGQGYAQCQTSVTFLNTANFAPLPLEAIHKTNPEAVVISVTPKSGATFLKYDREKVIFSRASGDTLPVSVALKLLDTGNWYTYNQQALPSCTSAQQSNNGASLPQEVSIEKPLPQKYRVIYTELINLEKIVLDLKDDDTEGGPGDSKEEACEKANQLVDKFWPQKCQFAARFIANGVVFPEEFDLDKIASYSDDDIQERLAKNYSETRQHYWNSTTVNVHSVRHGNCSTKRLYPYANWEGKVFRSTAKCDVFKPVRSSRREKTVTPEEYESMVRNRIYNVISATRE